MKGGAIEALDTVAEEAAEQQLNRMIERRADKAPDPDELEPSYAESVRRYNARRRDENRWAWVHYFERLAANHAQLAEENRSRAEALIDAPGEGGS